MDKTILIVEDDETVAEFEKFILEREGFNCKVAADGEKAIEIIQTTSCDIILLDLFLPKKSGQEIIKFLQEKGYKIPVIVITGQSVDEVYRKSILAEPIVEDFITKPIRPAYIIYKIHSLLGTKPKEMEEIKKKKIEIERYDF